MSVNALILAAGKSSRFNGIKSLATVHDNTLLEHVLNKIHQTDAQQIYVALGSHQQQILPYLPMWVRAIYCKNSALGLGHTIADAVKQIGSFSEHLLISPVDQVAIPASHFQLLMQQNQLQPQYIIATKVKERLMAPAIFPNRYFNQLTQLKGDKGAGGLLNNLATDITAVPCSQALFDIDTRADLSNYLQMA